MKHAIIVAHPNPRSLSAQIAGAYAAAVAGLKQEALVRDLYQLGFDPRLRTEETSGPNGPTAAEDVVSERALLADTDVFAFIYPLWFNAPPAMLKGYVDRVFSMGFGFAPDFSGGNQALLDGKRLISFTTSGAPDAWVKETGAVATLTAGFDHHVAAVCGLTLVDHVNFGGIVPGITEEAVEDILAKVRASVSRAFDPAANVIA
jgi:NAD(P)H dehydrogenase (quinone)